MRGFRPKFFSLVDQLDWWWKATPLERAVYLTMLRVACERGDGVCWVSPIGVSTWVGSDVTRDDVEEAYGRLADIGALCDESTPSERWVYRLRDFERFAAALDTARARAREQYEAKKAAK
jgi:hypothetical protein